MTNFEKTKEIGGKKYVWMEVETSTKQRIFAYVDIRLADKPPEFFNIRYDNDPNAPIEIDDDKYLYVKIIED